MRNEQPLISLTHWDKYMLESSLPDVLLVRIILVWITYESSCFLCCVIYNLTEIADGAEYIYLVYLDAS